MDKLQFLVLIVYNYDADLEVSDTCVRSSLLSWVELSRRPCVWYASHGCREATSDRLIASAETIGLSVTGKNRFRQTGYRFRKINGFNIPNRKQKCHYIVWKSVTLTIEAWIQSVYLSIFVHFCSSRKTLYVNIFHHITLRLLSVSETAIALRPFLFSVHPDLFGKFPKEQVTFIVLDCSISN